MDEYVVMVLIGVGGSSESDAACSFDAGSNGGYGSSCVGR